MELKDILAKVDHTLLAPGCTWEQIKGVLDDGIKYGCASCCIPPIYVKQAKEYVGDKLPICTVIGFPHGSNTTATKVFETENAVKNGADEIDMVINISWMKDKKYDDVLNEIKAIKAACNGKLLKVIVETSELDADERAKITKIVSESGADYIKTSTGYSSRGANEEDIKIFNENKSAALKIKASAGIKSVEDAEKFIELGASRLGTSRVVKAAKALEN